MSYPGRASVPSLTEHLGAPSDWSLTVPSGSVSGRGRARAWTNTQLRTGRRRVWTNSTPETGSESCVTTV